MSLKNALFTCIICCMYYTVLKFLIQFIALTAVLLYCFIALCVFEMFVICLETQQEIYDINEVSTFIKYLLCHRWPIGKHLLKSYTIHLSCLRQIVNFDHLR